MATSAEQLQPGTLLNGRYEIVRPLGRGGMGTVFLAQHLQLQAMLAIKEVCSPGTSEEERQTTLEQYQREARFLVHLNHPNLPKVTDAFIENDRFYLVMELIEGVTLESRLKERASRPLPVIQVLEWALQITDVLEYLHHQDPPIVFRDLKPSNVMLKPDGTIRLIDFGIARRFQEGAMKDTALFGSIGYSPPEQFGRQQTDPRSDIYALGATLHQMLTGIDPANQPFKFVPVQSVNPAVPELLSQLIQQCLAMEPDARPADMHHVAMGLVAVRELVGTLEPEAFEEANTTAPPDILSAATMPGSPSGSPSGSSGPRIISAKLAEAEAQRKRSGSREVTRPEAVSGSGRVSASGANVPVAAKVSPAATPTPPSAHPRSQRTPLIVGAVLLLLLSVSGMGYVYSAFHRKQAVVSHPTAPPVTTPITTNVPAVPDTSGQPVDPSSPNLDDDTHPANVNKLEIVSSGLVQAGDKSTHLQIRVQGDVTGNHADTVVLTGQFTDKEAHPLSPRRSNSPYAPNNYLGIPETRITLQGSHFEQILEIPMTEFETSILNGTVLFVCTAKQGIRSLTTLAPYEVQASVFKPYLDHIATSPELSPPTGTLQRDHGGNDLNPRSILPGN